MACIGGKDCVEPINEANIASTPWGDDLLNRSEYADFLTAYLVSKVRGSDGAIREPFTLAIDAKWGEGKTFFVSNWAASLAIKGHPTILFDAWKSDYASDPIIAFMAELKASFENRIKQSDIEIAIKTNIKSHINEAVQRLRHAVLPASKQIAKGLWHKATGIAIDELLESVSENNTLERNKLTTNSSNELNILNEGLDKFFDKVLEEQGERTLAINEFKYSIKESLDLLSSGSNCKLPMFVFIDELDRCRPNFAISLLEGIKHIFDIKGVCFVFSTNLEQLSHSVKALYGQDFDARGYLKRFFNVESSLPPCTNNKFISAILKNNPDFNNRKFSLGLPAQGFVGEAESMDCAYAISWVSEYFSIDLRMQRTLVEMISACMAGIQENSQIYILWLSALCSLKLKRPDLFNEISEPNKIGNTNLAEILKKIGPVIRKTRVFKPTARGFPQAVISENQIANLAEILNLYYDISLLDLVDTSNKYRNQNHTENESVVLTDILKECPYITRSGETFPPSFRNYIYLVKYSGYISSN
jgi:hypothetical protein